MDPERCAHVTLTAPNDGRGCMATADDGSSKWLRASVDRTLGADRASYARRLSGSTKQGGWGDRRGPSAFDDTKKCRWLRRRVARMRLSRALLGSTLVGYRVVAD